MGIKSRDIPLGEPRGPFHFEREDLCRRRQHNIHFSLILRSPGEDLGRKIIIAEGLA